MRLFYLKLRGSCSVTVRRARRPNCHSILAPVWQPLLGPSLKPVSIRATKPHRFPWPRWSGAIAMSIWSSEFFRP